MDERHALVEAEPGEAAHVAAAWRAGSWSPAGNGTQMPPFACSSPTSRPPSVATSARAPARGEPGRDVDGGALGAARLELRDDLQDRAAGERVDARVVGKLAPRSGSRRQGHRAKNLRDQNHGLGSRPYGFEDRLTMPQSRSMSDVGARAAAHRRCSVARRAPGPPVVWLGGFRSDMRSTKAEALDAWAAARRAAPSCASTIRATANRAGASRRATISRWLEDALAVLDALRSGPPDPRRLVDGRLDRAARDARALRAGRTRRRPASS